MLVCLNIFCVGYYVSVFIIYCKCLAYWTEITLLLIMYLQHYITTANWINRCGLRFCILSQSRYLIIVRTKTLILREKKWRVLMIRSTVLSSILKFVNLSTFYAYLQFFFSRPMLPVSCLYGWRLYNFYFVSFSPFRKFLINLRFECQCYLIHSPNVTSFECHQY